MFSFFIIWMKTSHLLIVRRPSSTSLLHQGSPSPWVFAIKGVLKSPGKFLESSLKGLMVKVSSVMKNLPLKLMLVENLR